MSKRASSAIPPHLSMEAYVNFVDESFRNQDIKHIRRQKELEERIEKRFSLGTRPR